MLLRVTGDIDWACLPLHSNWLGCCKNKQVYVQGLKDIEYSYFRHSQHFTYTAILGKNTTHTQVKQIWIASGQVSPFVILRAE